MDSRLRGAARAINAAGPPWHSVSESVARAVRAADPSAVATTMRAGADPELLARMLLVYSDLVSRRAAMTGFEYSHEVDPAQERLLVDLGRGGPAAARFAADLASLRTWAARSARFTPQAVDSRASADLQLMVRFVDLANRGCESRGGVVLTELPTVVWRTSTSGVLRTNSGSVGFLATRHPGHPWTVELLAC
jgi:hypothetical protein